MKVKELIDKLQPYADKELFIDSYDVRTGIDVEFSFGEDCLTICRRYGEDETKFGRNNPVSIFEFRRERKVERKDAVFEFIVETNTPLKPGRELW